MESSWEPKYDLDIKGIDGSTAYHLAEAITAYLARLGTQDEDIVQELDSIARTCRNITEVDERD